MTNALSTSSLDFRLKAFLCASVDDTPSAEPLSVVSALARLDIDPWSEAAELSRLSRDAAARRLGGHLARVSRRPGDQGDHGAAAERLIGLLPRSGESAALAPATPSPGGAAATGSAGMIIIFLVASAFTVATFSFITAQHLPDPLGAVTPASSPGPPGPPLAKPHLALDGARAVP